MADALITNDVMTWADFKRVVDQYRDREVTIPVLMFTHREHADLLDHEMWYGGFVCVECGPETSRPGSIGGDAPVL
jgi:hypothetical protein